MCVCFFFNSLVRWSIFHLFLPFFTYESYTRILSPFLLLLPFVFLLYWNSFDIHDQKLRPFKSLILRAGWDFPGGKESACQWRRHEFNPWSKKIPHAAKQLSPCATTTEPVLSSQGATATEPPGGNYWSPHTPEPVVRNKRSHHHKKPTHHHQRKVCTAAKTQHSQKQK